MAVGGTQLGPAPVPPQEWAASISGLLKVDRDGVGAGQRRQVERVGRRAHHVGNALVVVGVEANVEVGSQGTGDLAGEQLP